MVRPVKLDATDLRIMTVLETQGRITNSALAEAVGLSPSPCLTRVDRLEKAGIITGYAARIDKDAIGELVTVFVEVTLHDRRMGTVSRFEQKLKSMEEIAECAMVSGHCDYILKIVARSVTHYRETVMKLVEESGLVDRYFSYFVVREFELEQRSFLNSAQIGE
ncbi:Lrp/AsnC family transcriptional regulator [Croceicoccus sp. YJ47]|uniref:Lrp/AsnC family transcriptional regulator n=1 Tax=Croceicoccus sp. YJ47 TaxID=2798724 RepID=UPI0019228FA5|nr:Lrp/AsnC family transcriptional regulator [Croceicoccus sp. YJ47]QQN74937.1 Lrp/AsnC family transcriptional regulator [Croceicoccus sp. YJ47]